LKNETAEFLKHSLNRGELGESNTEARMTDKFTALKFKIHFSSHTVFIFKAYIHKMDNI